MVYGPIKLQETVDFSVDEVRARLAPSGWRARLDLEYSYSVALARTNVTRRSHSGPLVTQKPLYPEGPQVCHTLILHPPGGIAGGDDLEIGIALNPGSQVLITMPGASKWYGSPGASAALRLNVRVEEGATLEWLPQETIVFNHAAPRMRTSIDLAAGACYIGWEILCLGRTASGETFDAGEIRQATEVAVAGDPVWSERCHLTGGSRLLASMAGLAGAPVSAVMLVAGRNIAPELMAQCRAVRVDGVARHGITAMPNILVARYVGYSSEQAKAYFIALWRLLRIACTGRAAVMPRIWST